MKTGNDYQNHDEGVEYPFVHSHDRYQEPLFHQTETDADGNSLEFVVELIMEHRLEPATGRRHNQETLADMDSLALKPSVSLDQPATGTFVDESDEEFARGRVETRKRRMVWSVLCFGFLVFIVVLAILLSDNRNNDDRGITNVIEQAESGTNVVWTEPTAIAATPTASPATASPTTASPTFAVEETLEFQTIGPKVEKELLLNATTPQGKAFDAILAEGLTSPSIILQRFALMVIYFSTNGPGWGFIGGWNGFTDNECLWFGVDSCSYQQEGGFLAVSNVGLDGNLLDGTIPSEICLMEKLETINLESNGLRGKLPACLASLTDLIQINVKTNDLTGVLPPNLLRAPSLEILNLSENNFSGDLSILFNNYEGGTYPAFGTLSQLNLDHNDFSGEIPSQLMFLQALEELTLEVNSLSGNVDTICNTRDIATFTVDCEVECKCCKSCF